MACRLERHTPYRDGRCHIPVVIAVLTEFTHETRCGQSEETTSAANENAKTDRGKRPEDHRSDGMIAPGRTLARSTAPVFSKRRKVKVRNFCRIHGPRGVVFADGNRSKETLATTILPRRLAWRNWTVVVRGYFAEITYAYDSNEENTQLSSSASLSRVPWSSCLPKKRNRDKISPTVSEVRRFRRPIRGESFIGLIGHLAGEGKNLKKFRNLAHESLRNDNVAYCIPQGPGMHRERPFFFLGG